MLDATFNNLQITYKFWKNNKNPSAAATIGLTGRTCQKKFVNAIWLKSFNKEFKEDKIKYKIFILHLSIDITKKNTKIC